MAAVHDKKMDSVKCLSSTEKDRNILQERICEVEKSISKISLLREELEENSKNVKEEVQASIGTQLHLLRQREVQLLRQVDALISHQSSLLQMQLGRLYQSLGALRSTLQWVRQGGSVDLEKIGEVSLGLIQTRHLNYKPMMDLELESLIQSFGRVEAKGPTPSVLMLPEEEDYGDGDHHVLHKALHDDYTSKIQMHFPKLASSQEYWLSVLKVQADSNLKESKQFVRENIREENEKWLQDLEVHFDEPSIDDDYYMAEVSEISESIELLSHPDFHDNNLWLQSPSLAKDHKSVCNCIDKGGDVEIENLDILSCIPNKSHQDNKMDEESTHQLSVPEIATVCRSSTSKCKTFNDCLCENNCLVSSLKEQMKGLQMQESSKQDCINQVIKATCMQQKRQDTADWLLQNHAENVANVFKHALPNADWLNLCLSHNNSYKEQNCVLKPDERHSPLTSDWLENKSPAENKPQNVCHFELPASDTATWISMGTATSPSALFPAKQPCQVVDWLTSRMSGDLIEDSSATAMREMFKSYLKQQMLCNWVADECDNKVQMQWLASY